MREVVLALLLALQEAPYSEVVDVWRHNLDVIVTDREGRPVTGLTARDFEVLEDGKPREITNFAAYGHAASPPPSAAGDTAPPPAPARRLIFFVDDMSVIPRTRQSLVKSAHALIDTMRPGDEGAVVRPGKVGERISVDFTGDADALRARFEKAVEGGTIRADVGFEAENRRFQQEAAFASSRAETLQVARRHATLVRRRVELRLATLRAVVATLAPLPGRKMLVIATESLPAAPGREFFDSDLTNFEITEAPVDKPALTIGDYAKTGYVDFKPVIREIARTASSNGVTIYSLRPELDLRIAPGENRSAEIMHRAMANTDETMQILTATTGGVAGTGASRMDDVLLQAAADAQSYYSLAFRAAATRFDSPHKVVVRVRNHPEYAVRARNEVARKSPQREMNDRVVAGLFTADMPNDLGIAIRASEPKPAPGKRGRFAVDVDVAVPMGRLTFLPSGKRQRARFTVHYAITSTEAEFVNGSDPEIVADIPATELEAARTKFWVHTVHLFLGKGTHEIAIGVLDGESQTAGLRGLTVTVR